MPVNGWSVVTIGLGIFVGALLCGVWNALVDLHIGF